MGYLCVKLQQWKCPKRNQPQELLLPKSQHPPWPVESTHFPRLKRSDAMSSASRRKLEREFQLPNGQRIRRRLCMLRSPSTRVPASSAGRRAKLSSVLEPLKSANLLHPEQFLFCLLVFTVEEGRSLESSEIWPSPCHWSLQDQPSSSPPRSPTLRHRYQHQIERR